MDRRENYCMETTINYLLFTLKMCKYFVCTLLDQLCILMGYQNYFTKTWSTIMYHLLLVPPIAQNTVQFLGQCSLWQISLQGCRLDIFTMKETAFCGGVLNLFSLKSKASFCNRNYACYVQFGRHM